MLKGNVKVTLFDKDGNVIDSQEKSNLVTNASSTVLNMCAGANSNQSRNLLYTHMPVSETVLGGLLLFEDSFDNPTVNTVLIPNDNYVVACADRGADTTSTRRGSLNNDESGRVTGGYKSVWDFSTSQANNTISSIALTSVECGANPFTCYTEIALKQFSTLTNGKTGSELVTYDLNSRGIPLKYDESTQEFYFLYRTNDSSPYNYKVCKARIPFYTFNVEDYVYEGGAVIETANTVTTSNTIQHYYSAIDRIGGYAYLGYAMSGHTLKYVKLNLNNFVVSEEQSRVMVRDSSIVFVVCDDIWYELDANVVYAKSEDGTLVNTYNLGVTLSWTGLLPKANGTVEVIRSDSRGAGGWVLYPDGTYDKIGENAPKAVPTFAFETNSLLICKLNSAICFYIKKDYLGTVFNLDTPVPKTSATTMKVEYTLTNVTS